MQPRRGCATHAARSGDDMPYEILTLQKPLRSQMGFSDQGRGYA